MGGAGVTVDASVFAAAIRIDACLETDVRAVISGDDRFSSIAKKLRLPPRPSFPLGIGIYEVDLVYIHVQLFESVSWTP